MSNMTVSFKFNRDCDFRLAVSVNSDLSAPTYFGPIRTRRFVGKMEATGLLADTLYYYAPECNGVIVSGAKKTFRTAPAPGAASFKFAFSSCNSTGSNATVFETIRLEAPLFFHHLGDWGYPDIAANSKKLFRRNHDDNIIPANVAALYAEIPCLYMFDDHDYGPNDSNGTSPSRNAALSVFRERVPHHSLALTGDTDSVYHSYEIGRVLFIVTDLRSMASPEGDTDNASKTKLGTVQKAWLKAIVAAPGNAAKEIVWFSTSPWVPNVQVGEDHWGGYSTERQELADHFALHNPSRILICSGDTHAAAWDDGTNSVGGIREFTVSPLDRSNGTWPATYTSGYFQENGMFGVVEVTDTGGPTISIALSVKNAAGTVLTSTSFVVTL